MTIPSLLSSPNSLLPPLLWSLVLHMKYILPAASGLPPHPSGYCGMRYHPPFPPPHVEHLSPSPHCGRRPSPPPFSRLLQCQRPLILCPIPRPSTTSFPPSP